MVAMEKVLLNILFVSLHTQRQTGLTTEGVRPPFDGDSCSSTHVGVGLYGLAQSHGLASSGTHVEYTTLKVWLRGHNRVAGLKDS